MNRKGKKLIVVYAVLISIVLFFLFGIITVLIPNKFYIRMTPVTYLDYIFLVLTSILLGTYISFYIYQKKHSSLACDATAVSGWFGGFLGFGCSICNKILILLLGVAGVLAYVESYRHYIGTIGIILLSYAVVSKGKYVL